MKNNSREETSIKILGDSTRTCVRISLGDLDLRKGFAGTGVILFYFFFRLAIYKTCITLCGRFFFFNISDDLYQVEDLISISGGLPLEHNWEHI